MTAPKRRWFRWSLRALLAMVTLIAIGFGVVGNQLLWLRNRREFFDRQDNLAQRPDVSGWAGSDRAPSRGWLHGDGPGLLWILGEPQHLVVHVTCVVDKQDEPPGPRELAERELGRKLFPEANVMWRKVLRDRRSNNLTTHDPATQ